MVVRKGKSAVVNRKEGRFLGVDELFKVRVVFCVALALTVSVCSVLKGHTI
jgi:hypothetical protein